MESPEYTARENPVTVTQGPPVEVTVTLELPYSLAVRLRDYLNTGKQENDVVEQVAAVDYIVWKALQDAKL